MYIVHSQSYLVHTLGGVFLMSENGNETPRERLVAEIPEETKQLLEDQEGYLWELVTDAVHSTYGGERLNTPAAIEREIELTKRKKRNAFERMKDAEEEYHRQEQRLESLEQRREEQAQQAESKTDALDDLLQGMVRHGHNMYIGQGGVATLANQWFGGDVQAAFDALKERNESGQYNLPESRFEEPGELGPSASGLKSFSGDNDE